jgi:hypothetical protein
MSIVLSDRLIGHLCYIAETQRRGLLLLSFVIDKSADGKDLFVSSDVMLLDVILRSELPC